MGFGRRTYRKGRSLLEWLVAAVLIALLLLGLLAVLNVLGVFQLPPPPEEQTTVAGAIALGVV